MKLEEIPPLKEVPAPSLSVEEEERIKQDLFKNYDLKMFKEAGDLSFKVADSKKKKMNKKNIVRCPSTKGTLPNLKLMQLLMPPTTPSWVMLLALWVINNQ